MDFIHDVNLAINKAYKGGVLTCEELYRISSQTQGVLRIEFYNEKDSVYYTCNDDMLYNVCL